jgi:hypothetical protein
MEHPKYQIASVVTPSPQLNNSKCDLFSRVPGLFFSVTFLPMMLPCCKDNLITLGLQQYLAQLIKSSICAIGEFKTIGMALY